MEIRRSRREQTPLSIIMLDIDKFKAINDTYGHLTGDQVIRAVCDVIKQQLKRPLDEVARYGGEEFVVLLPNTNNQGALAIAEQIRCAIEKTLSVLQVLRLNTPLVPVFILILPMMFITLKHLLSVPIRHSI